MAGVTANPQEATFQASMGPIANMICTDHLRNVNTSEGMTAAIAAISSEMGDAALARQFQSRVQSRLREREI